MSLSHFSSHFSVNYYFAFPTSNVFHSTVNTSGLPQLHTSISTWNTHKNPYHAVRLSLYAHTVNKAALIRFWETLSIIRAFFRSSVWISGWPHCRLIERGWKLEANHVSFRGICSESLTIHLLPAVSEKQLWILRVTARWEGFRHLHMFRVL